MDLQPTKSHSTTVNRWIDKTEADIVVITIEVERRWPRYLDAIDRTEREARSLDRRSKREVVDERRGRTSWKVNDVSARGAWGSAEKAEVSGTVRINVPAGRSPGVGAFTPDTTLR
jgi:hypothetical protein